MAGGYESVAGMYDRVNADIDYKAWADFFDRCFERYMTKKPEIILDLACGTGRMTMELCRRGYDMIGADRSEDMLSVAFERMYDEGMSGKILYLCQDMRSFELYGTVDVVCCCLDSVNYLLSEKDLRECFLTVHNYLNPDGLFLFDVNTPYKFENIYSDNSYVLESEDDDGLLSYCGWQNEYDRESRICNFYLSVFTEDADGRYVRTDEVQKERCYDEPTVRRLLTESGFELEGIYGGFDFSEPLEDTQRWYIVARAKK